MLREAEVGLSQGMKVRDICRGLGISEQTYYRWRREYGGLKVSQVKRFKELEKENSPLKYGRYGYRRVTARLRREGWRVNHKRVQRI